MQTFSGGVKENLSAELVNRDESRKETTERRANLDPLLKKQYNGQSLESKTSGKKKHTNISIPLPALKKFASEFAPGMKKNKPYLAKPENVRVY